MTDDLVSPPDCAVAIAFPLTQEDFFKDIQPGSGKDFIRSFAATAPRTRVESQWERYRPVADAISARLPQLESMGVAVVTRVNREQLMELLRHRRVVTVMAHWRFDRIVPDDIVDTEKILAELELGSTSVRRALAASIVERGAGWLLQPATKNSTRESREELARQLDGIAEDSTRAYRRSIGRWRVATESLGSAGEVSSAHERIALPRPVLEAEFPGSLRQGRAVELGDGFVTISQFTESIPQGFAGVLDLSICNSIFLAEAVKRVRRDCLVVTNEQPAVVLSRFLRYVYTIRELKRSRGSYVDALLRVTSAL